MTRRWQTWILLKTFEKHSENLINLPQKSVELYTIMSVGSHCFISLIILGYETSSGDYRMTTLPPSHVGI
ncbi:hypothetical protein ACFLXU_07545, partial [Chloroflexota bacterium]